MSYLIDLESSTGERFPADIPRNAAAGQTLYARYDLDRIRREVSRATSPTDPRTCGVTRRCCRLKIRKQQCP